MLFTSPHATGVHGKKLPRSISLGSQHRIKFLCLFCFQATGVHGKEAAMALRVVPASGGRPGVAVSCSTKKDARVYDLSVRV